MHLVLLPGLDGTGELYAQLVEHLPENVTTQVVSYPARGATYDELETQLSLPDQPYVVAAESYSGPLAIRLARRAEPLLRGVILIATFAEPPLPSWLRLVVGSYLFWLPPPKMLIRRFLVGRDAPPSLVRDVRRVISQVPASTLAARARQVLGVDAREYLRQCTTPLLYITPTRDQLIGPQRDRLLSLCPSMQCEQIDGPHLIAQRHPREVATLIERFCRACSP